MKLNLIKYIHGFRIVSNLYDMMRNLKFICAFLIVFVFSSNIFAQTKIRKQLNGEFIGGITGSSLDFVGNNEYNQLKIGFQMGFLFSYAVVSDLEIQSGFIMKKKGGLKHYKYTDRDTATNMGFERDTKLTADANYMYIPLNLGFRIALNRDLDLAIFGGAYGAYGFKGYMKQEGHIYSLTNGTTSADNVGSTNIFSSDMFNRWDYGLNGSLTLYYDNYLIKFEFEYGLADIATKQFVTSNAYDLKASKIKTMNTAISLGFRF